MKYEFKNLQTGKPCCSGNSNPPRLCPACLEQFKASVAVNTEANRNAALVADRQGRALTVAAATATNEPPAPPSLVEAIRGSRGAAPLATAPSFRKPATVLSQHDGVDAPPSLVDAIRRTR